MVTLKSRVLEALQRRFPEAHLSPDNLSVLHKGRFANAIVFRYHDEHLDLVVKDYSHCPWILRNTIGRFFITREAKNLQRLHGTDSVVSESYRLSPIMLAYPFTPGVALRTLRHKHVLLPTEFFYAMEKRVAEMHERNVVHLDLRNLGNVLCTDDGSCHFIDFQSAISLRWVPRWLHNSLKAADRSAVYKSWALLGEEPLPEARRRWLERFNRLRKRWIFRGYPVSRMLARLREAYRSRRAAPDWGERNKGEGSRVL